MTKGIHCFISQSQQFVAKKFNSVRTIMYTLYKCRSQSCQNDSFMALNSIHWDVFHIKREGLELHSGLYWPTWIACSGSSIKMTNNEFTHLTTHVLTAVPMQMAFMAAFQESAVTRIMQCQYIPNGVHRTR